MGRIVNEKFPKQAVLLTGGIWIFVGLELFLPALFLGKIPVLYPQFLLIVGISGLTLSLGLLLLTSWLKGRSLALQVLLVGAGVAGASALLGVLDAWMHGQFVRLFLNGQSVPEGVFMMAVWNTIGFSWIFGLLTAFYLFLHAHIAARQKDQELAEARELAKNAQLDALRLQLNPHFLFNTLNAISSLIVTGRNSEGEQMLNKLSAFLRSSIREGVGGPTTLSDELATLQNYLEIEGVRFGDRLTVEFQCPDDLLDVEVPEFILQPLIENAIKYAVSPTKNPVTIRLIARQEGKDLFLTVSDNGTAGASSRAISGTGIGLSNVRRRLEVLYGGRARLEAIPVEDGFIASLRLPLPASSTTKLVA